MTGVLVGAGASLYRAAGGGGGEITFDVGVVERFADEVADGTTAAISPSGSDRAIFGGVAALNAFGGAPTITECRYGGSGGTLLTELGAEETFFSANAGMVISGAVPGPSGSNTIYGLPSGGIRLAVGAVCYTGVNQTTAHDSRATNTGGDNAVTTTVGSVTLTGGSIVSGSKCYALIAMSSSSDTATAFTAVAGTTIRAQAASSLLGMAFLEATASSTSVTLSVNCNQSSSGDITWTVIGARIVPV